MKNQLNEISNISDVGYLLVRLKLAKRKKENETVKAILNRLIEIGVLKYQEDVGETLGEPFKNLRAAVKKILAVNNGGLDVSAPDP